MSVDDVILSHGVDDSVATLEQKRILHKTIKKVTHDIESLDLNTAISALHIATRDLLEHETRAREILEPLAQLFAPFAPHFAEEVWARSLGKQDGISYVPWPRYDDALATDETITMGVQVGGKTYGTIAIDSGRTRASGAAGATATCRQDDRQGHLQGGTDLEPHRGVRTR